MVKTNDDDQIFYYLMVKSNDDKIFHYLMVKSNVGDQILSDLIQYT